MISHIWTFLSGIVVGGLGAYAISFIQESAKLHAVKFVEFSKKNKTDSDMDKVVEFLRNNEGHHEIHNIRDEVFGKDLGVEVAYVKELLQRSFDKNRNVGTYENANYLWFYVSR